MAQWIECWAVDQKLASLIPRQATCLGCGPGAQLGCVGRRYVCLSLTHQCFSPTLSLSLSRSLKTINKILKIHTHKNIYEVNWFLRVIFQFYLKSNTYHIGWVWGVRKNEGKIWTLKIQGIQITGGYLGVPRTPLQGRVKRLSRILFGK